MSEAVPSCDRAGRRARHHIQAGMREMLVVLHRCLDAGQGEGERAVVFRLFLHEYDLVSLEARHEVGESRGGEGGELLQPHNGRLFFCNSRLCPLLCEVIVDLTRADHHCLCIRCDLVKEKVLEALARGKLIHVRHGLPKAKKRFGCNHDERLSERCHHLSAEKVEVLGRRSGVHHCHVVTLVVTTIARYYLVHIVSVIA
mmetsp:Transcript_16927/g.42504  ORF Transcript_16927/g.42504 Transcript_16927/m.42504 type:complete len:200 (-) Transcript_16927:2219-2818(-)